MAFESGIDQLPEKAVICVEEAPGVVKEAFILKLAAGIAGSGKKVIYLTTRKREDILTHMQTFHIQVPENFNIIDTFRNARDLMQIEHGEFCVMDSFSTMFSRSDLSDFEHIIQWLLDESRKGTTFVLLLDTDVLPSREEQLLRAMSDGVSSLSHRRRGTDYDGISTYQK